MEYHVHGTVRPCSTSAAPPPSGDDDDLRRGPWTVEEDLMLMNYIRAHGEGRWNSLACSAGLKRTGKSCRLRWLNYLRPDVRRGNITPEEQLLILELHSRWGNRWSKIAQHLPGRTDNEIKNYWRTRVQKHAKQLQCDVNSKQFKDLMRYLWMPRLVERIRAASGNSAALGYTHEAAAPVPVAPMHQPVGRALELSSQLKPSPENSSFAGSSSDSVEVLQQLSSPMVSESFTGSYGGVHVGEDEVMAGDNCWIQEAQQQQLCWPEALPSPGAAYANLGLPDFDQSAWEESLWTVEDLWFQPQF